MQNIYETPIHNTHTATLPRTENVYSNIGPGPGFVTSGDHATSNGGRTQYTMMTSCEGLSRNFNASRSQWSVAGNYRGSNTQNRFSHLAKLDFALKIIEIILLTAIVSLYSNTIPSILDIFEHIIFPILVYSAYTVISLCAGITTAFKIEIPPLYLVIIDSLGAILLNVSGGMMLGVWFLIPRKVKAVLYWESRRILIQSMLSFVCTIVFLADLACSLNTLNGNR